MCKTCPYIKILEEKARHETTVDGKISTSQPCHEKPVKTCKGKELANKMIPESNELYHVTIRTSELK